MPKRKISTVDECLGRNLTYYRKLEGLTQQQVADKLNLNLAKILHVEVGALLADDSGLEAADASEDWQHDDDMHRRYSRLSEDKKAIIDQMLLEMTEEN